MLLAMMHYCYYILGVCRLYSQILSTPRFRVFRRNVEALKGNENYDIQSGLHTFLVRSGHLSVKVKLSSIGLVETLAMVVICEEPLISTIFTRI